MKSFKAWVVALIILTSGYYFLDPVGKAIKSNANLPTGRDLTFVGNGAEREPAQAKESSSAVFPDTLDKYRDLPAVEVMMGELTNKLGNINRAGTGVPMEPCDCKIDSRRVDGIQYEAYETCSPERNTFKDAFAQVSPDYRLPRSNSSEAQVPKACVLFVMRDFFKGAESSGSRAFASCNQNDEAPTRGAMKPCVTEDYVNVVYNSFIDVADCFDIPQKDMVPKIYNESGFHVNTFGGGADAGVGQLTKAAIDDVNMNFDSYQRQVAQSTKASCQRLKKNGGFNRVSGELAQRCQVLTPPENPLRNLVYSGVFYRQNKKYVESALNRYKIDGLMKQAGLKAADMEEVRRMMMSLGYNSGAGSAVIFLKNYLESRINIMKKSRGKKGHLRESDFDFSASFDRIKRWTDSGKNPKALPIEDLSFPEYLRIYQSSGAPGYLSFLHRWHQRLGATLGEGTCSPIGYLRL